MNPQPLEVRPLSGLDHIIVQECGGDNMLAGKMLAVHRTGIFTQNELFAVVRCVRFRDQIADMSIGNMWREELDRLQNDRLYG